MLRFQQRSLTAILVLASLAAVGPAQAQSPQTNGRDPFEPSGSSSAPARQHRNTPVQLPEPRDPFLAFTTARRVLVDRPVVPHSDIATPLLAPPPRSPRPVAPKISVRGIVESASGNFAILSSAQSSAIVRTGDCLAGYQVGHIGRGSVDLAGRSENYKLSLTRR